MKKFGARWPLVHGTLSQKKAFQIPREGSENAPPDAEVPMQTVSYVERAYAVLNQKYLSLFHTRKAAADCKDPERVISVDDILSVRPSSPSYLLYQREEINNAKAEDDPARGLDYCFLLKRRDASEVKEEEFCSKTLEKRAVWLEILRRGLRMKIAVTETEEIGRENMAKPADPRMFPAAPKTICGVNTRDKVRE